MDHDSLQQLTARLDRLEAENDALRAVVRDHHNAAALPDTHDEATRSVSRRVMIGGGVAAALGTLASTTTSSTAAAMAPMVTENSHPVAKETSLFGSIVPSSATSSALSAANLNAQGGTGITGTAWSAGVRGEAIGTSGVGVHARGTGGGAGLGAFYSGDAANRPPNVASAGVRSEVSFAHPSVPAFLALANVSLRSVNLVDTPPTADGALAGDLTVRKSGDRGATWWVCVAEADGAAAPRFVRVAAEKSAGAFETLPAPIRVYDSRPEEAPATGPKFKMSDGFTRSVSCTLNTNGAVPSDANAVMINLAVTNTTGPGFVGAYPFGVEWPGTSSLNFEPGQSISNTTVVGCGPNAQIELRAGTPGTVDVVIDVIGFYR